MSLQETIVTIEFIAEMKKFMEKPEGKTLLEACSESPILFSKYMLNLELYSWQINFLNKIVEEMSKSNGKREFLALTSRQIGKSTAVAIFSLWCVVFNKYPGTVHNNTVVGVISASDVQSKKLLEEIKKFIHLGDKFMEESYGDKFGKKFFSNLVDDSKQNNTSTITFKPYRDNYGKYLMFGSKSGSVIKSYPPTAVVLGETFTIVIEDEAGKTDRIDDQFHYDYAYPTGNSTNAVRLYTSTPWSPTGFFYRLADPLDEYGNSPAERFLFTIDAIRIENPKYYEDVMKNINQMNGDGKTAEVQRGYYCRFVKGEKNYFDPDRVTTVFQDYEKSDSYKGECDLGVDFGGQVTSRTVLTVSKLDDSGRVVRLWHKTYEVGQDDNLIEDISLIKSRFNIQRIIPDDCPQGDYMIRKMIDLGWQVTPMNFRTDKVKKYGAFRNYLNKGRILSYHDTELKTEMMAMEFSEGSRQSVIMHAPGYTDDLIDSFVLSSYHMLEEDNGFNFHNWNDDEENND